MRIRKLINHFVLEGMTKDDMRYLLNMIKGAGLMERRHFENVKQQIIKETERKRTILHYRRFSPPPIAGLGSRQTSRPLSTQARTHRRETPSAGTRSYTPSVPTMNSGANASRR